MSTTPALRRGAVFLAEHDNSYPFWDGPPRKKLCLVFNVEPVSHGDVHYFFATSKVWKYRAMPSIMTDVRVLPQGSYDFFPEETLLDFRYLHIVPLMKLKTHNMTIKGRLTDDDIYECAKTAAAARILGRPDKRLLALR